MKLKTGRLRQRRRRFTERRLRHQRFIDADFDAGDSTEAALTSPVIFAADAIKAPRRVAGDSQLAYSSGRQKMMRRINCALKRLMIIYFSAPYRGIAWPVQLTSFE